VSHRSSQATLKLRSLTPLIPALMLLTLCCAPHESHARSWTSRAPEAAPAVPVADQVVTVERAELLPAYATWPGHGDLLVPGVYHTRRLTVDARTGEPLGLQLAIAEPRMLFSHATGGQHPPRIALTFDDGPNATYTPQMLDVFAKYNARATFMVLGGLVGKHKQILARAEREGHEIGIHSWWHASYTGLSSGGVQSDIARCRTALEGAIDGPVRWVRPPYGSVNDRVRAAINDAGYHVAMWSIDPRDWQNPGSSVVADRILSGAKDGAVVVLHDGGGNRSGTVAAMRTVIPALQKRGYQIVTLSELTGLSDLPPSEQGMRLSIEDKQFEVEVGHDDVKVTVDGRLLELDEPPVMINDQFLVQARPVLTALASPPRWNAENLAVAFDGVRGEFIVKLNSLDVTLSGEPLLVQLPSIYYHGMAMLPVSLMAKACGATIVWNSAERTLEFTIAAQAGIRPPRQSEALMTLRSFDGLPICWWPRELTPRLTLARHRAGDERSASA
jgi:peptidoglycan/xylan/chitin deacetylase (PgdA/CDA1 family)